MKNEHEATIITIYIIIDAISEKFLISPPQKQKLHDARVVTIAVCSALFFNRSHDKPLAWLHPCGYFPTILSLSRYNRRVLRLQHFIEYCVEQIFTLFLFPLKL